MILKLSNINLGYLGQPERYGGQTARYCFTLRIFEIHQNESQVLICCAIFSVCHSSRWTWLTFFLNLTTGKMDRSRVWNTGMH